MTSASDGAHRSWGAREEERHFSEVEERLGNELNPDEQFPRVAAHFHHRVADIVKKLPDGYSSEFLANVVSSCNFHCLRTWRDYVRASWETADPNQMLSTLQALPTLKSYLNALELEKSIVNRHPSLAKDDLVSRNAYANGGRWEDYFDCYGVKIQPPHPSLSMTPRSDSYLLKDFFGKSRNSIDPIYSSFVDEKNSLHSSSRSFHLCQTFSLGRQRSKEPAAFGVVYGNAFHRLVIADSHDSRVASREQILITPLSPQVLYIKNTSEKIDLEIQSLRGSIGLEAGESCLTSSDATISCNTLRIEIIPIYNN